jgi:hypothetical protein
MRNCAKQKKRNISLWKDDIYDPKFTHIIFCELLNYNFYAPLLYRRHLSPSVLCRITKTTFRKLCCISRHFYFLFHAYRLPATCFWLYFPMLPAFDCTLGMLLIWISAVKTTFKNRVTSNTVVALSFALTLVPLFNFLKIHRTKYTADTM